MTGFCKNCKFCEKKLSSIVGQNDLDDYLDDLDDYYTLEDKYFCKLMPKEIETQPYNWCGQFRKDD